MTGCEGMKTMDKVLPVRVSHPQPAAGPLRRFAQAGPLRRFAQAHPLRRFAQDEDGGVIALALYMFVLMLMLGGMAVDVMRHESLRTRLQNTADRAVLAAASLTQSEDPVSVVDDYFAKAGLSEYLADRSAVTVFGSRTVDATVSGIQNNLFMGLLGIDTLPVATFAAAEEAISEVEVSLVVDVSNSMNSNNRIQNLRVAGENFIDLLIGDSTDGDISISLVPYSGQVNVGSALLSQYNVAGDHTYSNCAEFDAADYSSPALSTTQPLARAPHFDPWYSSKTPSLRFCSTDSAQEILPLSNNAPQLKSRMQNLTADGNTSIDIAVKWGAALLDPGTRPVIASLATAGVVPSAFSDRPFDYGQTQVRKVMVVMTDGENWDEFTVNSPYRNGLSPIWINTQDNRPSIWHESRGQYYIEHLNEWRDYPWGASITGQSCGWVYNWGWQWVCSGGTVSAGTSQQQTWPEVWNRFTPYWVAAELYGNALGSSSWERQQIRNQWRANFVSSTAPSTKNTRLEAICTALKNADDNLLIFAIGFEATTTGRQTMQNCASSPGHYYDADGLELNTVFGAIARQISQLRLTQ